MPPQRMTLRITSAACLSLALKVEDIGLSLRSLSSSDVIEPDVFSDDSDGHQAQSLGHLQWWEALAPGRIDFSLGFSGALLDGHVVSLVGWILTFEADHIGHQDGSNEG